MRPFQWFLTALLVLFAAQAVGAQENAIGLFSDIRGCPCEIMDVAPGLITVTVLHVNSPGAKASRFWVPTPSCFIATFLADTAVFPVTIGSSQTGVTIGYDKCRTGTFQILTIRYFGQGMTGECCYYPVLPDPAEPSGRVVVADCNDQLVFGTGWAEYINSSLNCVCIAGPEYCFPVAVDPATWGRVKALYRGQE